jgi:hypothetical protein
VEVRRDREEGGVRRAVGKGGGGGWRAVGVIYFCAMQGTLLVVCHDAQKNRNTFILLLQSSL